MSQKIKQVRRKRRPTVSYVLINFKEVKGGGIQIDITGKGFKPSDLLLASAKLTHQYQMMTGMTPNVAAVLSPVIFNP